MYIESTADFSIGLPGTATLQLRSRPHPAPPELVRHRRDSAQRRRAEDFVRTEFLEHFNARIRQFMPTLLELQDARNETRAVVGCRSAAEERLFLEAYTDGPIEQILARRLGVAVPRAQIVEVGSLACRNARAAVDIVKALIPFLLGAGFTWVAFTGADTVRNVFRYLGLAPFVLCAADQSLVGAGRDDWGTYYDHDPKVMTGRLGDGLRIVDTAAGLQ